MGRSAAARASSQRAAAPRLRLGRRDATETENRMTLDTRFSPQPARGCTRAVRAGIDCDAAHGAVTPPLHLSSNFAFAGFNGKRAYDYTRSGNPTRDLLAEALRDLEEGAGGVITSSGMAAVALVQELVPPDSTVVAAHDCYGGTWRLLDAWAPKGPCPGRLPEL